jgi:hypothetical protein
VLHRDRFSSPGRRTRTSSRGSTHLTAIPRGRSVHEQTTLKNTLRWLMGEEQITHLGMEYYQG